MDQSAALPCDRVMCGVLENFRVNLWAPILFEDERESQNLISMQCNAPLPPPLIATGGEE